MNKCAIYARVSTEEQKRHGVSLDAQVARNQQYAESMKFDVVYIGVEAQSGKDTNRPELQKILKMVARKEIQHFLAIKLDRLTRETIDALQIGKEMAKKGCMLHFTTEYGQVDLNDPMQEYIYTNMASVAKLERRRISINTKFALARKRDKAERISGSAPYGYTFEGNKVVENKAEQGVINRIFDLKSTGISENKIIAQLASEGVLSRSGKPFVRQSIRNILAKVA